MKKLAFGGLVFLLGALGGLAVLGVWLLVGMILSQQWNAVSAIVATLSAVFAAASAMAAAVSARANVYNTKTFERQLRNSTIDACVSAAIGLRGAINRALKVKKSGTAELGAAYTDAWSAFREFDQKLVVVKRYVAADHYPKGEATALAALLDDIREDFWGAVPTARDAREADFQQRAKAIIEEAVSKLQSAPMHD